MARNRFLKGAVAGEMWLGDGGNVGGGCGIVSGGQGGIGRCGVGQGARWANGACRARRRGQCRRRPTLYPCSPDLVRVLEGCLEGQAGQGRPPIHVFNVYSLQDLSLYIFHWVLAGR